MAYPRILQTQVFKTFLAVMAGGLLTLAFAPFNLFPLAFISTAILLFLWLDTPPLRSFWLGLAFGIGFFGTSVYWVFTSIYLYGDAPWYLAGLITASFVLILGLFPGINGGLLNYFFPKTNASKLILAFPASWVLLEWIRSWLFTGFPWSFIGYSQIVTPLKGYAPLFSVFGVSIITLIIAGLVVHTFVSLKQKYFSQTLLSLLAILVLIGIGHISAQIDWTHPDKKPLKVSLVQGNIAEAIKWSEEQVLPTLNRYVSLTNQHLDSQIIVWPESAIPILMQDSQNFLNYLNNLIKSHNSSLITGIPIRGEVPDTYYNGIITLGNASGYYLKERLVPFGEYIPLRTLFQNVLNAFNIPMSNFISGENSTHPIIAADTHIAAFICYEIAFPDLVRSKDNNINMILTINNDGWFGESIAPAQHLEIAQMRALELGKPLLFLSNNGLTAFIDPKGNIQSIAPPFVETVLTDFVQPMNGYTPWKKLMMSPIFIMWIAFLAIAFWRQKK